MKRIQPPVGGALPADPPAAGCPLSEAMAVLSQALPRGRQRRKAARPQELLDAALDLFVEKGLAATRAEEVAHRAGVSKGTLYLYYPSKDELFKAVVRSHLIDAISAGDELADHFEGSTSELLRLLAETWWTKVGSSKAAGLLLLIMSEARAFPDVAQFYLDE
ncbi:TetR/AcrR family transcriptional regulator, partial [Aquabacterium sp. UBA2148]|uniref:TetR/AcrR family transcriptional regulator n=1 Tax=Aquabacterium sp. UBA2148 TaxID=1946042 RepID=UPI0039C8901C